jgi:hypothetical protein
MSKIMTISPWVSHFVVFILGSAVIFPYDQPCQLDIKGIAVELSGKQKRILQSYERKQALYPLRKQGDSSCLITDEAFFLFESGDKLWALFQRRKGALKGIKALLEVNIDAASKGIKAYPACQLNDRIQYD